MSQPRPLEPIVHLDMDAFYASVEVRKDPSLAGKPVLVGGRGGRGVVASASYEARARGVRSAMPMSRALRLCPDAVVCTPDFDAYRQTSDRLRAIMLSFTPLVEPLSLDEAFCDVGGSTRLFGPPERIGALMRAQVREQLGLVASVGIAPSKFLAKLCSEHAKPDGLLHLPAAQVESFLATLTVRDLWGVGAQTGEKLERFGLRRVPDLLAVPESTLARIVGPALARHLRALARGNDDRPVVPYEPAKSVSAEETFDRDVDDPAVLRRELLRLAERVGRRLRSAGLAGRTVNLKLRYANFQTVTRARTLPRPTDEATVVHREALALLDGLALDRARVRLLGVGVSKLGAASASGQLDLLADDRWGRLERAADKARGRFGEEAVTRGALLDDSE